MIGYVNENPVESIKIDGKSILDDLHIPSNAMAIDANDWVNNVATGCHSMSIIQCVLDIEIKIRTCLHLISFISTIIMRYIVIHVTVFYSNHIHVIIKAIYTI